MKIGFLSFVLLCLASRVVGQSTSSENANASRDQGTKESQIQTVRGCLSHESEHIYILLAGDPGSQRQYRIIGGKTAALKKLKEKVGHTVEVTGPVGIRQSGASTNGKYNAGSTTGVGYDTIKAQSVKDVFDTCS
jgi:hypothetical protein